MQPVLRRGHLRPRAIQSPPTEKAGRTSVTTFIGIARRQGSESEGVRDPTWPTNATMTPALPSWLRPAGKEGIRLSADTGEHPIVAPTRALVAGRPIHRADTESPWENRDSGVDIDDPAHHELAPGLGSSSRPEVTGNRVNLWRSHCPPHPGHRDRRCASETRREGSGVRLHSAVRARPPAEFGHVHPLLQAARIANIRGRRPRGPASPGLRRVSCIRRTSRMSSAAGRRWTSVLPPSLRPLRDE